MSSSASPGEVVHATVRGAIAAMAMTGMRKVTKDLGIVGQTSPQAILRQRAAGLLRRVPRGRRQTGIELAHRGYGAAGGAAFALLPADLRRQAWAGPAYGLMLSEFRPRPQEADGADAAAAGSAAMAR